MVDHSELILINEARLKLGKTRQGIHHMIRSGVLEGINIGGKRNKRTGELKGGQWFVTKRSLKKVKG